MRRKPSQDPVDVLSARIATEVQAIRSRDPELSAILDISPRPVEHEADRQKPVAVRPSLTRVALRQAYRTLYHLESIRPLVLRIRSGILERLESKPKDRDPNTVKQSFWFKNGL